MGPTDNLIRILPPFLHWHPDGEIRLVGHRIGLYHFVRYYKDGLTAEMLLGQFPTLPLPLIRDVIAFYLENSREVNAYLAEYQGDLDQLRAAGSRAPSLGELAERRMTQAAFATTCTSIPVEVADGLPSDSEPAHDPEPVLDGLGSHARR
jgi:uncharacterized protein (DUF433 family)